MPYKSVSLTWENLDVFAPPEDDIESPQQQDGKKRDKHILNKVSGSAEPGEVLAIIGASGAGKTTLLNALNGRSNDQFRIEGRIKINGLYPDKGLASFSAYVQQDEMFHDILTVREHLWVQAMLRMDNNLTDEEKLAKIDAVIEELSLTEYSDTLIQVLSVGDKKKLSFASAVLTDPIFLCCDEPTSNVDSYMAQNIVSTLKFMASQGRTILCTIHQPSSEVWTMFESVLIMAEGRVAFLGSSSDAFNFFADCGFPCPMMYNPADHYIHTLAIKPTHETKCRARIKKITDRYDNSAHALTVIYKIDRINMDARVSRESKSSQHSSPYKSTWLMQLYVLTWRCFMWQVRQPKTIWTNVIPAIGVALLMSAMYWDQKLDQNGVFNLNGVLFVIILQVSLHIIANLLAVFPLEYPMFIKEHYDGMYRVDTYYLSKGISDTPVALVVVAVVVIPTYWLCGFTSDVDRFFVAIGMSLILVQTSLSAGYLLSSTSTRISIAMSSLDLTIIPFMIVGGYYISVSSIPDYMIWIRYMSWFPYANEILIVNQWQGVKNISCSGDQPSCFTTGEEVIADLGFHQDNVSMDYVLLIVLMVVYRLAGFLIIFIRVYRRHIIPTQQKDSTFEQQSGHVDSTRL